MNKKAGRNPMLDEENRLAVVKKIRAHTQSGDMFGVGFAMAGSFLKCIESNIRDTMRKQGVSHYDTCDLPFTHGAIDKLYRSMCAGKVYAGDQQNLARFARRADLGGLIAMAAVTYAAMCGTDGLLHPYSSGGAIRYGLTFSEDAFALCANPELGEKKSGRGDVEVLKKLRTLGQGSKSLSASAQISLNSKERQELTREMYVVPPSPSVVVPSIIVPTRDQQSSSSSNSSTSFSINLSDSVNDTTAVRSKLISRDTDVQNNIVTLPTNKNDYPPSVRTLAKRGYKLECITNDTGKWLACIITIVERNAPIGFNLTQLSSKLWCVIRTPKGVVEQQLAGEKQVKVFLPAMVAAREIVIADYIIAHNLELDLAQEKHKRMDELHFKRDDIHLKDFPMLKTMDGCGSELNAILDLIGKENGDSDIMYDAYSALLSAEEQNDDHIENDDSDFEFEGVEDDDDVEGNVDMEQDDVDPDLLSCTQEDAELDDFIRTVLPPFTRILKHLSQGTSFAQAQDASKGHSGVKKDSKDTTQNLMENRDEGSVPVYMSNFMTLLENARMPKASQRTFFQIVANLESRLDRAMSIKVMKSGYRISGQGASFSVRQFLNHWVGQLDDQDYDYIDKSF